MSGAFFLKAWTAYLSCLFTGVLDVSLSPVMDSVLLVEEGLGLLWNNLGLMLSANFLPLFLACLEAMDPISLEFFLVEMLTVLEVFNMVSRPAMHFQSFFLSFDLATVTR